MSAMRVEAERPTIVCVLGMSRSGTSLTARILNLAGVYLGPEDELLWHRASNARGHWESRPMLRFNEWLLRSLGGSWRTPPAMPPGWERSEALAAEREMARRFVEDTFGRRGLWGWKDPRNSLTLPFWQRLLPELRYVICLRNPLDVAASLRRREGMGEEEVLNLWRTYAEQSLANTQGGRRIVVSYEDYFTPGRSPVERLLEFACGSAAVGAATIGRIEATIEEGLRHHSMPVEAALAEGRLAPEVADLYRRALAASQPLAAPVRDSGRTG